MKACASAEAKNQRLIDVQASLQAEEVVTYNYNPVPRIA